jgi:hypothetical protein
VGAVEHALTCFSTIHAKNSAHMMENQLDQRLKNIMHIKPHSINLSQQDHLVHSKKEFRGISNLLGKWIEVIKDYDKAMAIPCYVYNERANVGILAAAAWKLPNWVALEEYATKKIRSSKEKSHGRGDLSVAHKGNEFAIEAKQAWPTLGTRATTAWGKIEKQLKAAFHAAKELQKEEAANRIALVFVSPRVHTSAIQTYIKRSLNSLTPEQAMTQILEKWLVELNLHTHDSFAFCFPFNRRTYEADNGYVYPGVLALLRHSKKSH